MFFILVSTTERWHLHQSRFLWHRWEQFQVDITIKKTKKQQPLCFQQNNTGNASVNCPQVPLRKNSLTNKLDFLVLLHLHIQAKTSISTCCVKYFLTHTVYIYSLFDDVTGSEKTFLLVLSLFSFHLDSSLDSNSSNQKHIKIS